MGQGVCEGTCEEGIGGGGIAHEGKRCAYGYTQLCGYGGGCGEEMLRELGAFWYISGRAVYMVREKAFGGYTI